MLKIYIEENAFAEPQAMEVSEDAQIARLIPALVREMGLPAVDPMGKRLVYVLRRLTDGNVLPGNVSLRDAGILPETYLALVPSSPGENVGGTEKVTARSWQRTPPAPSIQAANAVPVLSGSRPATPSQNADFYSDQTIGDASAFSLLNGDGPVVLPPPPMAQQSVPLAPTMQAMPGKRRSRRMFFLLMGSVLGAAGAGLAYAAYNSLLGNTIVPTSSPTSPQTAATTGTTPTSATTLQATLPTQAKRVLSFTQHQQTVHGVVWSPDGTMLVSGASDRLLLTWDLNKQVHLRRALGGAVHAVAWSPDGAMLAGAVANQIFFLNAQSGVTEARTGNHLANITALAWSPKQTQMLVSTGLDQRAIVWNTQTFKAQTLFRLHTAGILAVSWASDGATVATGSQGGAVRVWNAQNGQEVHGFYFDTQKSMDALAFNPTTSELAVGGADHLLRLWKNGLTCQLEGNGQQKGQCVDVPQRLQGHTGAIRAVSWSPDGRFLATAGDDGMLIVWYPAQGNTPLLKVQQNAPVLALAWSPDGKKIADASGTTVTIWELM